MRHVIRSIGLAFVLAFAVPTLVRAQPTVDVNTGFQCRTIGVYQALVTTTWVDLDTTSFAYITTNLAATSDILFYVTVENTHASQILYVLLKAGTGVAITDALPVAAGKSVSLPGLAGTAGGSVAVSLRGSASATTGTVVVYYR